MHRHTLSRFFDKRVSEIGKYLAVIPLHFDHDDVHDFRVEIKKLRALLRLAELQISSMRLPGKLRKIYHATGNVRSVQLQKKYIRDFIGRRGLIKPVDYFQLLNGEELRWRMETQLRLESYNWDQDAHEIRQRAPSSLKESCIAKYSTEKALAVNFLLNKHSLSDAELHDLRKLLKDVMYNWPFIQNHITPLLPVWLHTYDQLHAFTDILGQFQDSCSYLLYVDLFIGQVSDEKELSTMRTVHDFLKSERDHLFSLITYQFLGQPSGPGVPLV